MSDQQPNNNQDLASIVSAAQEAAQNKNIPPYIGGVAENYVAPWQTASNFGNLEPGRAIYGPTPTATKPFSTHVNAAGYASLQEPAAGPAAPIGVKPKYRVGDQNSVVLGLSPEKVYQLKQQLVDSGLAPKGILTSGGFWDSGSANAMTDVLAYANVHGMTWHDAMDTVAAEATTHPKPRDVLPPQIISTKSAVDLRDAADKAAAATLGRKLTAAEQARFVSAWQTADIGRQRKIADINLAYAQDQKDKSSGLDPSVPDVPQITTMTDTPDPEAQAKQALQATPEGQAKSIADTFDAFKKLLGGIVPGTGG